MSHLTLIWQIKQKQNPKIVHFLDDCPGVRVTVLLVFILSHFSSCSAQYLLKPYRSQEFTQSHTNRIQLDLPAALNWIIIFTVIITGRPSVITSSMFSTSGHCLYSTRCTLCCVVTVLCEEVLARSPDVA